MDIHSNLWGKTIFLDNDNNYQIIWLTNYNQKKYIYLLNIKDYSDAIFCEIINDNTLRQVTEKKELYKIINVINGEITRFAR